jgi:hypothetical protein
MIRRPLFTRLLRPVGAACTALALAACGGGDTSTFTVTRSNEGTT